MINNGFKRLYITRLHKMTVNKKDRGKGKMRKLLTILFVLGFVFILTGCNTMSSVDKRLEDEGYTLEMFDDEAFADEIEGNEETLVDLENIYTIFNEDDVPVGMIFEFKNANALNKALVEDGEDPADHQDDIYKNLVILANDYIKDIIKGE